MKTVKELNNRKVPIVAIDPAMNMYSNKVNFPDKLAKTNKMLKTAKLPSNQHSILKKSKLEKTEK